MELSINAVTLAVDDLARSKAFYADGLGCTVEQDTPAFVSFSLNGGSTAVSLYPRRALARDAGVDPAGTGFGGITLNCFVPSDEAVDRLLASAEAAGGSISRPAERAGWGGYFGYFGDPDGYLWKAVSTA